MIINVIHLELTEVVQLSRPTIGTLGVGDQRATDLTVTRIGIMLVTENQWFPIGAVLGACL
jgi:hypothetical protein